MVHYRVTLETICLKKEGVLEISGNQSLILRERTAFGPRMLGTINAATATPPVNAPSKNGPAKNLSLFP